MFAQVLGHLGSGAEIALAALQAAMAGQETRISTSSSGIDGT